MVPRVLDPLRRACWFPAPRPAAALTFAGAAGAFPRRLVLIMLERAAAIHRRVAGSLYRFVAPPLTCAGAAGVFAGAVPSHSWPPAEGRVLRKNADRVGHPPTPDPIDLSCQK